MIAMRIKINTPEMVPIIIATDGSVCDDDPVVVFPEKVTIHSSVVSLKNRLFPTLTCMKKRL